MNSSSADRLCRLAAIGLASAATGVALWELQDRHTATVVVAAVVAGLWAAGSVVLAERRPAGPSAPSWPP